MYRITPLDPTRHAGPAEVLGALFMGQGVQFILPGDYDSTALKIIREYHPARFSVPP